MALLARLAGVGALALSLALSLAPAVARGQSAPAVPSDVVRLKNGGLVRGTIVELVPNGNVTITLATGATRTFPMGEVTYAGPAEGGPKSPAPAVPAGEVRVKLTADPGTMFHASSSGPDGVFATFRTLCTAPCEVSLPVGIHHFALSLAGEPPLVASSPVLVEHPSEVLGAYDSYRGVRIAGIVIMAVSFVTGAVLIIDGTSLKGEVKLNGWEVGGGAASIAVGGIVGGIMVAKADAVRISVVPLTAASRGIGAIGAF